MNMPMHRARLPLLTDWLQALPANRRVEMWPWVSSLPRSARHRRRVVDWENGKLDGYLGEEWVPVAEHPEQAVWIVRRVLTTDW